MPDIQSLELALSTSLFSLQEKGHSGCMDVQVSFAASAHLMLPIFRGCLSALQLQEVTLLSNFRNAFDGQSAGDTTMLKPCHPRVKVVCQVSCILNPC